MQPFLHRKVNKVRLTLMLALAFTTLAAGVFRTPAIIFMASLLMSAPLLGIAIGRLSTRRLAITRVLPEIGTVGDIVEGSLTVANRSRWPALLVHVYCGEASGTEQPHTSAQQSTLLDEDTEEVVGDWAVQATQGREQIVPLLHGNAQFSWRQNWLLRRRGVFEVEPARAGTLDPLGIYISLVPKTKPHELLVLPRPIRVNRLGLLGGSTGGDTLPHHATVVADALDFHGVRPWSPGEAIRRVHWKSTARTRELHVVEWEENVASDLAILLDTQAFVIAGSANDNTLETAITLTASIAAYLLENGYRLQLYYWQSNTVELPDAEYAEDEPGGSLRLICHETGNANGLGSTLRLLAHLQPTQSRRATAAYLSNKVRPLLPDGRRQLLITSTLADIEPALAAPGEGFRLPGFSPCQALAVDATSFDPEAAGPVIASNAQPYIRLVRRDDSIRAILEQ